MTTRLRPGDTAPALTFETLRHGRYDIHQDAPAEGTFVAFYRGGHCKWTRLLLKELDDRIGDFAIRGVRVVAVSADDLAATQALQDRMQIVRLPLAHGLAAERIATEWGLHLTRDSTEPDAPALMFESAQFWIKKDGTLGVSAIQTSPSLWADATNMIRAIDTGLKFPERGRG